MLTIKNCVGKRVLYILSGVVGCYEEGQIIRLSDSESHVKIQTNDTTTKWYDASDICIIDTIEK